MMVWQKYLDKLGDKEKREVVVRVLEMARKYAPEVEAALPYGVPGWKWKGKNLVAVAAHKDHLGIYPFSPEVVAEVMPKLGKAKASKGTIKFGYDRLPDEEEIGEIVGLSLLRIGVE